MLHITLHAVCVLVFTVSHKQQKCSCINLLAMQLCFTPTESVDCHCIINGLRGEGEEGHRSPAWQILFIPQDYCPGSPAPKRFHTREADAATLAKASIVLLHLRQYAK